MWDPDVYLAFADHRARPFYDLLSRVGADRARRVVDLGCGAGNVTVVLRQRFPAADIASIGKGFGFEAVTVRSPADLDSVRSWVSGPRSRPILIDAKVTQGAPSWWLEEAFRAH